MRYCGFRLAIAGSRANNTPRLIPNPPKRRPIAPKRPIFSCFHPMGLQFGGNTTSNRDLSTSQRGKWHHERRDTPTTRRSEASNAAKPPPLPAWRAPQDRRARASYATRGQAAVPADGGGAWPNNEPTHQANQHHTKPTSTTPSPTGEEGAGGSGGHGRASRRGAERSEVAKARGRPGSPAPGTPVGPQATPHSARQYNTPLGHDKAARPHRGRAAVAVALGFEPRVAVTPHSISSAAPSAARTRYLTRILYYTDPPTAQIDRAGWEQGHTTPHHPAARRPGSHEQARTPMGATAVSKTGLARAQNNR